MTKAVQPNLCNNSTSLFTNLPSSSGRLSNGLAFRRLELDGSVIVVCLRIGQIGAPLGIGAGVVVMEGVLRGVGFRIEVESNVVGLLNVALITLSFLLLTQPALHSLPVASLG